MGNKFLDTALVDKAIKFAVDAHSNTERRGKGFPYVIHTMEAMEIVATISSDPELLAAAALHDTVEDTDVTIEQIREVFGDRVAGLVEAESDKFEEGVSEEESWHSRKQAAIDRLAAASCDAKIVAMGDKLSNMRAIARDYAVKGDNLWNIFHCKDRSEHEWHYRSLAGSLKELCDTFAYKEFVDLINQVFSRYEIREKHPIDLADYEESGDGFTAISYNHKDGRTMMKLYSDFIPHEVPAKERRVAQAVRDMGLSTPAVGRIITDGKRVGVEFERISPKKSFARAISQEPEKLEEYAVRYAHQCMKLHSTQCDTTIFQNVKDRYIGIINASNFFDNDEKLKLRAFVNSVPAATTCLHGDLHIGNIITDGTTDYWIDLSDFTYGNPLFDMGMMYFNSFLIDDGMVRRLYHISQEQMREVWRILVREYYGVDTQEGMQEVMDKVAPFAALMLVYFLSLKPMPGFKEFIQEKIISKM